MCVIWIYIQTPKVLEQCHRLDAVIASKGFATKNFVLLILIFLSLYFPRFLLKKSGFKQYAIYPDVNT